MSFTKITAAGIGSTETVTLDGLSVINNGSFGGNLTVSGVLTYEDVTNVDSVGLITARNGIVVGSGITLSKDGDGFYTGVVTATTFSGNFTGGTFTGDGSTTAFTLTQVPSASSAANFIVFVNNVYQRYGSSYAFTVDGATLTFTSAPPSGTNNIQVTQLSQQNTLNSVADGAITQAKLSFDPADDATALAIALG